MRQQFRNLALSRRGKRKLLLGFTILVLTACSLPVAAQVKPSKIQQSIDAIKEVYDNEKNDYITDGIRIVWVKSYKKWTPDDLLVMKKQDPKVLNFLHQVIEHNRLDVLEQLLPDYYRYRGGAKGFAEDINKVR